MTPDIFRREILKYTYSEPPNQIILSFNTEGHLHILRMRLGLSGLNSHRKKFHFIPHSTCTYCQSPREDICHFFLLCAGHAAHRGDMLEQLGLLLPQHNHLFKNLSRKNINELCKIMLYGINDAKIDKKIFNIVAKYIVKSKRFSYIQ